MIFRGTEKFTVEVASEPYGEWTLVLNGILTNAWGLGCDMPLETFHITPTQGRYFRFTVKSYYGDGGGLQFITFNRKFCECRFF